MNRDLHSSEPNVLVKLGENGIILAGLCCNACSSWLLTTDGHQMAGKNWLRSASSLVKQVTNFIDSSQNPRSFLQYLLNGRFFIRKMGNRTFSVIKYSIRSNK